MRDALCTQIPLAVKSEAVKLQRRFSERSYSTTTLLEVLADRVVVKPGLCAVTVGLCFPVWRPFESCDVEFTTWKTDIFS